MLEKHTGVWYIYIYLPTAIGLMPGGSVCMLEQNNDIWFA
jgi:hypothetical protein